MGPASATPIVSYHGPACAKHSRAMAGMVPDTPKLLRPQITSGAICSIRGPHWLMICPDVMSGPERVWSPPASGLVS